MREKIIVLFLCGAAAVFLSGAQENPRRLFQQALYQEEIRGDLEAALKIYQEITVRFSEDKETAARAQYRIGLCYEKLGDPRAGEAFQRVLDKYPRQFQWTALAEEELKDHPPPDIHPLVRHYFERNPPDPMTSISRDGSRLAYTDWSTGNLMIRDRKTGLSRALTGINGFRERTFYFHPVWSGDGAFIACSVYRGSDSLDLYVIEVETGEQSLVYSGKKEKVYPQDWSPDNQSILAHVIHLLGKDTKELLFLFTQEGGKRKITDLSLYSRGLKFSPGGEAVAYDLIENGRRHVYVHLLEENRNIRVTTGLSTDVGFDSPCWSEDGSLLLYRNNRRYRFDLWAVPVDKGKPAGKPRLVHADIIKEFLKMKRIDHSKLAGHLILPDSSGPAPESFKEDFSDSGLDDAWMVFEWDQPNVYGYEHFGRYSLDDNSGFLRYYPGPASVSAPINQYLPIFTSYWYWYYPCTEVFRMFRGTRWVLEFRTSYFSVPGLNSRSLNTAVFLNPHDPAGPNIFINRDFPRNTLKAAVRHHDRFLAESGSILAPGDRGEDPSLFYRIRIYRADNRIRIDAAPDGEEYRTVLTAEVPKDSAGSKQKLSVFGTSWYVPALAYGEYDYFRLRPLKNGEVRRIQKEFKE